jgi:hypothetical protein
MPASAVSVLPRIFRWVFTFLAVVTSLGAVAIVIAMVIDPHLPQGTHFGPAKFDWQGQAGSVVLRATGGDSDFTLTALKGSLVLFVDKAGGFIEVLKHHGLPVMLIDVLFLATLFELLRRLFRNVGRGESFTRQSMVLVQLIGGSLIVFSFVSYFAENWFATAAYSYLAQHAVLTISGTALHLPQTGHIVVTSGGSPVFFSGLLVLALSEVFRQGLALKNENDLTV